MANDFLCLSLKESLSRRMLRLNREWKDLDVAVIIACIIEILLRIIMRIITTTVMTVVMIQGRMSNNFILVLFFPASNFRIIMKQLGKATLH